MRTLIISGGTEGIQRFEIEEKDYAIMVRAAELSVELHNSTSSIENRWVWGEEGTSNDPTLAEPEE